MEIEQVRTADKPSLTLERHYPVAPEKVWRAWTEPEAIGRWFGPDGPQNVSRAELDVRVGGSYRICFGGADGNEHECAGVYREVVPGRRLVFTWTWPRTTPERESLVTITLRAARGGTDFEFRQERFFDATVRDNHKRGWSGTFDKLGRFLAGER
ncbi:MAG TPA: SRPBCC domain-containing protein [Burkholderiales bacterium]|nr:SRPBCC domain-containing protein [Burkholderiales bacterium]